MFITLNRDNGGGNQGQEFRTNSKPKSEFGSIIRGIKKFQKRVVSMHTIRKQ